MNASTDSSAHAVFRRGLVRTFQIPRELGSMSVLENLMLVPAGQAGEKPLESLVSPVAVGATRRRTFIEGNPGAPSSSSSSTSKTNTPRTFGRPEEAARDRAHADVRTQDDPPGRARRRRQPSADEEADGRYRAASAGARASRSLSSSTTWTSVTKLCDTVIVMSEGRSLPRDTQGSEVRTDECWTLISVVSTGRQVMEEAGAEGSAVILGVRDVVKGYGKRNPPRRLGQGAARRNRRRDRTERRRKVGPLKGYLPHCCRYAWEAGTSTVTMATNERPDQLVRERPRDTAQVDNIFPSLTIMENLQMGAFVGEDGVKECDRSDGAVPGHCRNGRGRRPGKIIREATGAAGPRTRPHVRTERCAVLDEPSASLSPKMVGIVFERISAIKRGRHGDPASWSKNAPGGPGLK